MILKNDPVRVAGTKLSRFNIIYRRVDSIGAWKVWKVAANLSTGCIVHGRIVFSKWNNLSVGG